MQKRNGEDIHRWPGQKHDLLLLINEKKKKRKKNHKPLPNAGTGCKESITLSVICSMDNILLSPAVLSKAAK